MAPRCSLLFFNSGRRAQLARDAFRNFLRKEFGEGSYRCDFVDAKSFHGGDWKDFHADFSRNLVSAEKPKIYLVFVAFGGMATGANLHQELPLPLPENANFFRYVGGSSVRRHTGADRVGVDVSDVVLAEQVTNVVSESNYLRIGHHLAAKGDFTWLQIGHKLFGRKDAAEPWWATSAAIKQTSQYVAAQMDIAMQSVGRMDRTLNSSYSPKVFLNSRFAGIFAAVTPDIVGETILPPAMRLVLESAKRQLRVSEVCTKTDSMARSEGSSREFFSRLAQEVRDSTEARDLWIDLREFLSSYVVVTNKDFLGANEMALRLNGKLSQYGVSVTDFYFGMPSKAVFSKLRDKWGLFFTVDGDDYRFFDPDFAPVDAQKCWYRAISDKKSGYVMMVRPAVMFDVVWPADYERTCRVAVTAWARKKALDDRETPLHLFERSDLFVPQPAAVASFPRPVQCFTGEIVTRPSEDAEDEISPAAVLVMLANSVLKEEVAARRLIMPREWLAADLTGSVEDYVFCDGFADGEDKVFVGLRVARDGSLEFLEEPTEGRLYENVIGRNLAPVFRRLPSDPPRTDFFGAVEIVTTPVRALPLFTKKGMSGHFTGVRVVEGLGAYYSSGSDNPKSLKVEKALVLRQVERVGSPSERDLEMMAGFCVDPTVRLNAATVWPAPYKLLREYFAARS